MSRAGTNGPAPGPRPAPPPNPPAPASVRMWWDGGDRAITAREKALIEEHGPSSFSIPLVRAADPQPAELAEQQGDVRSLAEHITDHLCHHEYDIGGRNELLACVVEALAATGKQQVGEVQGDGRRDRTPADYAIEHAGYLVTAANQVLEARNELDGLLHRQEEGDGVDDDEIEAAKESVGDANSGLRLAIHEFEKRRDRALAARQPVPAQGIDLGQFREAVQEAYENADGGTLNKFSLEELLALIDQRDAAPGVDRG